MAYRYELHCHTNEGSKCSDISIKEMFRLYEEMGYSGICITDHFTNPMNNKKRKPFSVNREITEYWQEKQFEAIELRKEKMLRD